MTRISFIMPTFNRADYIAESIHSIMMQMDAEDELIVVNDGSTDQTQQVVAVFGDRLSYVSQENAGKSVALNLALSQTDGQFVWICDDDDLLRPGVVDLMMAKITDTSADMVFGGYTRFRTEAGKAIDMGTGYWPDLTSGSLARHILEDSFVMHNASLVRRDAYERMGPFDERMLRSQDYEMFVRLALGASIDFVDAIVFDQRKHEGARGPAKVLHTASKSASVWRKYDALIFEGMQANVPLQFFENMFVSDDAGLRMRAALFQRAAIFGRHGLWAQALQDIAEACSMNDAGPLQDLEAGILARAVAGKHGFSGLLDAEIMAQLKAMKRNHFGNEVVEEIANGMIWRLRGNDPQARTDAIRFGREFGLVSLVIKLVGRRFGKAKLRPSGITENCSVTPLSSLSR